MCNLYLGSYLSLSMFCFYFCEKLGNIQYVEAKKEQELKKGETLNGEGGGRVNEKGKCSMSCVPVILCNVAVEPRRRGSSLLSSLKKANWTHRQGQGEGEGRCK